MTTLNPQTSASAVPARTNRFVRAGLTAAALGALITSLVFLIETSILNINLALPLIPGSAPTPPPLFLVILSVVIPALFATALLAILLRVTPSRGLLVFQIIAAVFLLISFGGPFALPIETAAKIGLVVLHITAGVTITGVLTYFFRSRSGMN